MDGSSRQHGASDVTELTLNLTRAIRESKLAACFRSSLAHHRYLIAIVLGYTVIALSILELLGRPYQLLNTMYVFSALVPMICWSVFLLSGVVRTYLADRAVTRERLAERLRGFGVFSARQVAYIVVPLVLLPPFASAFSSFKSAITDLSPFAFDLALHQLDLWIHFGTEPWRILHPLLGYPLVTAVINFMYNIWLPVFYVFLSVMIFRTTDLALRIRYLLSFILLWIIGGTLMATGLSSAGPCFFGEVTGLPDSYAPLLEYLRAADREHPIWSLRAQQYLWDAYTADRLETGGGISAMPSMHVAIASLQALAGWRLSRRLGLILGGYALVILAGSVHLAWHYAVDGYVAILCALLIWALVGRFVERSSPARADQLLSDFLRIASTRLRRVHAMSR